MLLWITVTDTLKSGYSKTVNGEREGSHEFCTRNVHNKAPDIAFKKHEKRWVVRSNLALTQFQFLAPPHTKNRKSA